MKLKNGFFIIYLYSDVYRFKNLCTIKFHCQNYEKFCIILKSTKIIVKAIKEMFRNSVTKMKLEKRTSKGFKVFTRL